VRSVALAFVLLGLLLVGCGDDAVPSAAAPGTRVAVEDQGAAPRRADASSPDVDPAVCPGGELLFDDAGMEEAVRANAMRYAGPVTAHDVRDVRIFYAPEYGIESLRGLQCFRGLEELFVMTNPIDDLSPLEPLTALHTANFSGNWFTDPGPLAVLTNLTTLDVSNTRLADFTFLARLEQLEFLALSRTDIEDLSPLSSLTNLHHLGVGNTRIRDLAHLRALTRLTYLDVGGNEVEDLSPLIALSELETLQISFNPIDCEAQAENLAAIQANGAEIYSFECGDRL
jgi:hypothetical protein